MAENQSHEDIVAVPRDKFAFAVELASKAGSLQMPADVPTQTVFDVDGTDTPLRSDDPYTRGIFAIAEHFADDDAYAPITARFYALLGIARHPELKRFVAPRGDNFFDVHGAIIYAAAETPLQAGRDFPVALFLRTVKRIAKEMEPHSTST